MSYFANRDEAGPIPPTDFDSAEVQEEQDAIFGWTKPRIPTHSLDTPDDDGDDQA